MSPAGLLLVLAALQGVTQSGTGVFPPGTSVPIHFLQPLVGGRDPAGRVFAVQTMSDLEVGGCIVVSAFSPVLGTVMSSRPGRLFGRRGYLDLRFDSIMVAPGTWAPIAAVLDSLEWVSHGAPSAPGVVEQRARSIRGLVGAAGAVGITGVATGIGLIPVAAFAGVDLVLKGPGARILSGQRGALRLSAPLVVPVPGRCVQPAPLVDSALAASLPPLPPRSTNKRGDAGADPINLVVRGTREQVDSAFSRAGWLLAKPSTFGALTKEVGAIIFARGDPAAPMSHEYYLGRVEDLRFERASPSARARHHVRLWQADATGSLWAAAATEDVGMLVSARRHTVTHKIAPDIDRERDLLVGELLAGGCAVLDGYVTLPGATRSGASVARQPYVTDARAAAVQMVACPPNVRPF